MVNNETMIQVPLSTFHRMNKALIGIEKFLEEKEGNQVEWVNTEKACELLGCSYRQLCRLKKDLNYKKIGKAHQYSRKSIEKYIRLMSVEKL